MFSWELNDIVLQAWKMLVILYLVIVSYENTKVSIQNWTAKFFIKLETFLVVLPRMEVFFLYNIIAPLIITILIFSFLEGERGGGRVRGGGNVFVGRTLITP